MASRARDEAMKCACFPALLRRYLAEQAAYAGDRCNERLKNLRQLPIALLPKAKQEEGQYETEYHTDHGRAGDA